MELEFLLNHLTVHLQADTQPIVYTVQQPTGVLSTGFQIQKVCISLAERSTILPLQTLVFCVVLFFLNIMVMSSFFVLLLDYL